MRYRLFLAIYVWMILVIFILPFFSIEGYSIILHTTSQLGAQHTPNAWIMNSVFILIGLGSIGLGYKPLKGFLFHQIALLFFGLALSLTGIFSLAPIDESMDYNLLHHELHSIFASVTGFSFTLLAISTAFIEKSIQAKTIAVAIGLLATLWSLLIFQNPSFAGIWQRCIFVFCIGWMLYTFHNSTQKV